MCSCEWCAAFGLDRLSWIGLRCHSDQCPPTDRGLSASVLIGVAQVLKWADR